LGAANRTKLCAKALNEFEAANPGMTNQVVLYPSEKFFAMYTASQTAGIRSTFESERQDLPPLTPHRTPSCPSILVSLQKPVYFPDALTSLNTVNVTLWWFCRAGASAFVSSPTPPCSISWLEDSFHLEKLSHVGVPCGQRVQRVSPPSGKVI